MSTRQIFKDDFIKITLCFVMLFSFLIFESKTVLANSEYSPIDKVKQSETSQITTSSRLLQLGETTTFTFFLDAKRENNVVDIFPCYLEQADL